MHGPASEEATAIETPEILRLSGDGELLLQHPEVLHDEQAHRLALVGFGGQHKPALPPPQPGASREAPLGLGSSPELLVPHKVRKEATPPTPTKTDLFL